MQKILHGSGKNQLLSKDDVGKGKNPTRDLPPDGFTFGKADKKDGEGASIGKLNQILTVGKLHKVGNTTLIAGRKTQKGTSKS